MFPDVFTSPPNADVGALNAKYGGWNPNVKNLFFANGQRDPWRDATVAADGRNFVSTPTQLNMVSDAFHCTDLIMPWGQLDPTVGKVQQAGLKAIAGWFAQAQKEKQMKKRDTGDGDDSSSSGPNVLPGVKPVNAFSRGSVVIALPA